jgi:predicted nucleic acid-binding protein
MATRTEAYVDTSALIAFTDRSDSYHALFRRLFSAPPQLLTTTLVVAEGHAWFLRRYDRTRALQFLAMIEAMKPLDIASVGAAEQTGAGILLRRYSDQNLTMTDAVGLHLMEQRRVATCWSTDFHLALGGVRLVINEAR